MNAKHSYWLQSLHRGKQKNSQRRHDDVENNAGPDSSRTAQFPLFDGNPDIRPRESSEAMRAHPQATDLASKANAESQDWPRDSWEVARKRAGAVMAGSEPVGVLEASSSGDHMRSRPYSKAHMDGVTERGPSSNRFDHVSSENIASGYA